MDLNQGMLFGATGQVSADEEINGLREQLFFFRVLLVVKEEHEKLNSSDLRSKMPEDWKKKMFGQGIKK